MNSGTMPPITVEAVLEDFVRQGKVEHIRVVLNGSNADPAELKRDPTMSTVRSMLGRGYSFSFKAEFLDPPHALSRLTTSLEAALGVPVSTHAYLSPPGMHVFGPHNDGYDVLAVQLEGSKL